VNSCSGEPKQQLLEAANNPAGSGYGFTHPNCDCNNCPRSSADWMIDWSGEYSEMWVRFYMKYEAGFTWSSFPFSYDKFLYFQHGGPSWIFEYDSKEGKAQLTAIQLPGNSVWSGTDDWLWSQGSNKGDGEWHCYEIYFKINPGTNGDTVRIWVDEVIRVDSNNAGIDSETPQAVAFGANQACPNNDGNAYIYFDDFKIVVDPNWTGFKQDANGYNMIGEISHSIALYRGEGVSPSFCLTQIEQALDDLNTDYGYTWTTIDSAEDIIDGVLQEADGSPAYDVIYFMGGSGSGYNNGLGETGKQKILDYVAAGGNFVGTCAGAFYGSANYTGLWSGDANYIAWTGTIDYILNMDHGLNSGFSSPLANVQYANGCWLEEGVSNTNYIATFDGYSSLNTHPAVIYSQYQSGGYVILSGGHPECDVGANNIEYFKNFFIYLIEGEEETEPERRAITIMGQ